MNFMNKVFGSAWWLGYLSMLGAWMISFAMPVSQFLTATIALVFCDLLTGTMAAKKRKERIHSRGLRRTVEKIVVYFIAILLAKGMKDVYLPGLPIPYIVAFPIALTEFKSNIENIETISGVSIWEALKKRIKL
ncbi:MAG: phage holin family protein [Bacteroidota bacterium]